MKKQDFVTIIDFLGEKMTDEQAGELLDKAKQFLSQDEIIDLGNYSCWEYPTTPFYGLVSEFQGEVGYCSAYN